MIQIQIPRFGGPEVFRVVELPSPPLAPGQVRIKVSAAGVNFADVHMRMGLSVEIPRLPFVPGFELAGVVSEVGPDVISVRRGERVLGACKYGGYTNEIVLPASQVRRTPRRLSDKEAAAVPVAFLTAWVALVRMARVHEADRVLVPGAAGGVGSAIVQMASRAGAEVVGLVGSPDKKDLVRSLGASQVLTYAELDARKGAEHRSFSLILEARGGSALKADMLRLAPAGRIVSYGVSSLVTGQKRSILRTLLRLMETPLFTSIGLANSNKGVFGLNMAKLFDTKDGMSLLMTGMDEILEGFQTGRYKAVVGKTFPLERVGEAHEWLQSRKSVGKVILTCA